MFIADLGRPKPRLVGVLVLQGLRPNHTYKVGLVQTPSGAGCVEAERTVTTNGKGNGILKMQELLDPGTTGAFFTAFSLDTGELIGSTPTFAISRLGPPAAPDRRQHREDQDQAALSATAPAPERGGPLADAGDLRQVGPAPRERR